MRTAIISFSRKGAELAKKIKEYFNDGNTIAVTKCKRAEDILPGIYGSLAEWTKEQFKCSELIIFVGACGIAVRSIAPFLVSKTEDPAVLVVDECAGHVISLLSGHIGGANEYAERLAVFLGAEAVITTASDCSRKPAVDMFAVRNDLYISDMKMAKDIEAALINGEKIGVYSDFKIDGSLPKDMFMIREEDISDSECQESLSEYGIVVGLHKKQAFKNTLWLIPRFVTVGVGCRRGAGKESILSLVNGVISDRGIPPESVKGMFSIDIKKDEKGLLEAAEALGLSITFYSAGQLGEVMGSVSSSDFVKRRTGVDNVCERAALLGAGGGRLISEKRTGDGVTVALACEERSITFG